MKNRRSLYDNEVNPETLSRDELTERFKQLRAENGALLKENNRWKPLRRCFVANEKELEARIMELASEVAMKIDDAKIDTRAEEYKIRRNGDPAKYDKEGRLVIAPDLFSMLALHEESKKALLDFVKGFDELHEDTVCHHMTIQYAPKNVDYTTLPLSVHVVLKVVGYAKDDFVQAVVVKPIRYIKEERSGGVLWSYCPSGNPAMKIYNDIPHITVSVSKEGKPVQSNALLAKGYKEVDGPELATYCVVQRMDGSVTDEI